jgi:hypothetical protein
MMAGISPQMGSDELSNLFNEKQVYCCYPSCPSFVSAIGNALGYAVHIEMLAAFVFVGVYIAVFKSEARSKGVKRGFFARLGCVWAVANEESKKHHDKPKSRTVQALSADSLVHRGWHKHHGHIKTGWEGKTYGEP